MKSIILLFVVIAAAMGLKVKHITGDPAPTAHVSNSMCSGKADGNYKYYDKHNKYNSHFFLQCSGGIAYSQSCWPTSLEFSETCNQCLYKASDPCVTTKSWLPATTLSCPDKCPHRGPNFSGNMADPYQRNHYIACWKGVTVGCVGCPPGLLFNEKWNACLYEGKFKTKPDPFKSRG